MALHECEENIPSIFSERFIVRRVERQKKILSTAEALPPFSIDILWSSYTGLTNFCLLKVGLVNIKIMMIF